MQAISLMENISIPQLRLGDARFKYVNRAAAALYGFDNPEDLVGLFLSQVQPRDWRRKGKTDWFLRQQGHYVPKDMVTVIVQADGTMVGQWRELVDVMHGGKDGRTSYLTHLSELPLRSVDHCSIRDVETYGESVASMHGFTGEFTVQDIDDMLQANDLGCFPLHVGETFPTIVAECERVSSDIMGKPGRGLNLALSDEVSIALHSKPSQEKIPVHFHHTCPECAKQWYGRNPVRVQCTTGCRKKFVR